MLSRKEGANTMSNAMMTLEEEREQTRALTQQIREEARNNPDSPYAGKFVGILHGQVVIVADTPDEVLKELVRLEPDPQHGFCVEVNANYEKPVIIWRSSLCRELHGC